MEVLALASNLAASVAVDSEVAPALHTSSAITNTVALIATTSPVLALISKLDLE